MQLKILYTAGSHMPKISVAKCFFLVFCSQTFTFNLSQTINKNILANVKAGVLRERFLVLSKQLFCLRLQTMQQIKNKKIFEKILVSNCDF